MRIEILDIRYKILDLRYEMLDVRCRVSVRRELRFKILKSLISRLTSHISYLNTHISILLLLISTSLSSQDLVESPLSTNAVLAAQATQQKSGSELKSASIYDTISLDPTKGLLDDFSYDGPYPDTSMWLDNTVFINRGYGKAPITVGIATFEGLNAKGYPYNFAVGNTSSISADSLTSKPIDLNYPAGDSIYLSFFCQPQGLGEKPETADSLVLEFKAPGITSPWKQIWNKSGSTLVTNDSSWTRVMIPITDTAMYLKKGFQFRFRNYATVSGNLDHWHIDYVYLNRLRSKTDTIFSDIAWVYNATPLLKNYRVMPWKQFLRSELRDSVPNWIRNNYSILQNINYDYQLTNDNTPATIGTFNGSVNLLPFDSTHIYTDCDVDLGCIEAVALDTNVFPASLTAPTQFSLKHFYTNTLGDLKAFNDTITARQDFSNYFAYDDGTAENAVGINYLNAQLAEKFLLNVGDTLQCIDIYFNPIIINATLYSFLLNVWNDNAGVPGTAVYTSASVLTPAYPQMGQNKMTRYKLEPPLYLNPGTFYIGFTQKTDQFLNIGQDKNTNSQDKIFSKTSGGWSPSPLTGSLLMHPLFGAEADFVGIENIPAPEERSFIVYPNPANDKLYIKRSADQSIQKSMYTIIDLYGREVMKDVLNASESIDISGLSEGIYFIRITEGQYSSTTKFIKIN